jgi:hypothetical protein
MRHSAEDSISSTSDGGEIEKEEGLISDAEVGILPDRLLIAAGEDLAPAEGQERRGLSPETNFMKSKKPSDHED